MFNLLFTYIKFDYEHLDKCVSKKINITFWIGYIVGIETRDNFGCFNKYKIKTANILKIAKKNNGKISTSYKVYSIISILINNYW